MKYSKYIQYLLFAISIILLAIFYLTQTGSESDKILDVNLFWAYALIGIGAALALFFPLTKAFKSKKGIITLLLVIAGIVVVIGGCYLLAPGNPIEINQEVSAATFKFTDTALYVTYVFVAASILALLWSAVRNSFKR